MPVKAKNGGLAYSSVEESLLSFHKTLGLMHSTREAKPLKNNHHQYKNWKIVSIRKNVEKPELSYIPVRNVNGEMLQKTVCIVGHVSTCLKQQPVEG